MQRRFNAPFLVFLTLTLIIVLSSIFSLVKGLAWLNKPFPGFLVYKPAYVGSFSSRDWPGKEAGLRYLDRILAVDGRPVRFGEEVLEVVRTKAVGTPVRYLVEKEGDIKEFTVPVDVFDLKDLIVVFSPTFICGLAIFAIAFIVYILKPNTSTSWVFLIMCFCLGIYGITGFEIQSSYVLVRFHYLILSLFPFCFLHLGLTFPERKQILQRFPMLEYLIYFLPLLLGLAYQVYFSTYQDVLAPDDASMVPTYVQLSSYARLFTLLGFVSLMVLVLHSYFKSSTLQARQRAKMMIFGVAVAFLPVGVLMILALKLKVYFPFNFIPLFTIFFPFFIGYSIVKHNMFDADVIIRRTVGYAMVTTILIGVYAGVSLGLNVFLGSYQLGESRAFPILFTLGVVLVFNPLRDQIQAGVDRLFYRKEYDYGEIVEKIGGAMTSFQDLGQILKQLTQTFVSDMFVDTSSIMLLDAAGTEYRVSLAEGEWKDKVQEVGFPRDGALMQILEKEKKELTRNDVLEDVKYQDMSEDSASGFEALHASVMVPMVFQDNVIGLMNLGEKKSGKLFNSEDIDLLRTLANQGAVAIENARLFQENLEKQRMEEELSIARDLQMSMLPPSCPEMEHIGIAASCVPAKEVGGDFYDFIEEDDERVGIVIGDVTGKSVSGALVMSASRSIFRILSGEHLDIGRMMVKANSRLKKDITKGMFVALLYATLSPRERTLRLCSAGQTQPVLFSSKTGEASLVETEGDAFPLGVIDDADYQETRLQLEPGDKVVLYTDGIVEAMNGQEEMFGFDRLLEVVRDAKSLSAEALLHAITEKVNDFAGTAKQHDDLTLIVLTVDG